ncbi:MAG: hypothetical protein ACD_72C00262G0004 [uncultured bacterium]|nr:MAG: hypothetical protein ACD_72C00262G0004 [uncultured bacterium]
MKKINIKSINFTKLNGLVPVVVQDCDNKNVLMVGFMNQEAFLETVRTKKVVFWSRSKRRLWQKGEKSKNYLEVQNIYLDCDQDSILILANPVGPTCHSGKTSCFGIDEKKVFGFVIQNLFKIINDRKKNLPKTSYTTSLFSEGLDRIAQKVGEEAVEIVIAGKNRSKSRLISESCDFLYHWLVLLSAKGVKLEDVSDELRKRGSL